MICLPFIDIFVDIIFIEYYQIDNNEQKTKKTKI